MKNSTSSYDPKQEEVAILIFSYAACRQYPFPIFAILQSSKKENHMSSNAPA
jgi:hypothetical protein